MVLIKPRKSKVETVEISESLSSFWKNSNFLCNTPHLFFFFLSLFFSPNILDVRVEGMGNYMELQYGCHCLLCFPSEF